MTLQALPYCVENSPKLPHHGHLDLVDPDGGMEVAIGLEAVDGLLDVIEPAGGRDQSPVSLA